MLRNNHPCHDGIRQEPFIMPRDSVAQRFGQRRLRKVCSLSWEDMNGLELGSSGDFPGLSIWAAVA